MKLKNIILSEMVSFISEEINNSKEWYHGTPDARGLEKEGGFSDRTTSVTYITDLNKYHSLQNDMKKAKESGNEDEYFNILNVIGDLQKKYELKSPIFLTDKQNVAKTYADPSRSFDYQNAEENVYTVRVINDKNVKINAVGQRFRFIDVNNVRQGFINAGVSETEFNEVFSKFNFYVRDKSKIKTDVIAAIGQWFKFDSIDVIGVLDSFNGGSVKSTVKMVFNPKNITIIK